MESEKPSVLWIIFLAVAAWIMFIGVIVALVMLSRTMARIQHEADAAQIATTDVNEEASYYLSQVRSRAAQERLERQQNRQAN